MVNFMSISKANFQKLLDSTCGGVSRHDAENTSRANPVNNISQKLEAEKQKKEQAFQELLDSTSGGANEHNAENTSRKNPNNCTYFPTIGSKR
jgi:hypothetical protein